MSEDSRSAEEQVQAAAKIQAGFRGYQVRKRLQEERDHKAKEASKPGQEPEEPGEQTRTPMEEEEQQPAAAGSLTLEDKSAAKIQAGVRGFLVRKRQQAEQAAATRIQAGFRGFRTRKLLKQSGQ